MLEHSRIRTVAGEGIFEIFRIKFLCLGVIHGASVENTRTFFAGIKY